MMLKLKTVGLIAVAAGALALGACDDDGGEDTASTMPTTATATMTMTATDDGGTDDETGDSMSDSSGDEIDCSSPPSHAADIQPIWDTNCVTACHEPGGSWQTTDLTDGVAYDALVDEDGLQTQALDVQLVTPGDIEMSYLINKLNNTQEAVAGGAAGTQMPQGMPPLSADEIALIEQWVFCGAEE